jgi:hypothetical protein
MGPSLHYFLVAEHLTRLFEISIRAAFNHFRPQQHVAAAPFSLGNAKTWPLPCYYFDWYRVTTTLLCHVLHIQFLSALSLILFASITMRCLYSTLV